MGDSLAARSGSLPLNRDTQSYVAVLTILTGLDIGNLGAAATKHKADTHKSSSARPTLTEREDLSQERAQAKREAEERLESLRGSKEAGGLGRDPGAKLEFRLLGDLPDLVASSSSKQQSQSSMGHAVVTEVQLPIDLADHTKLSAMMMKKAATSGGEDTYT